MPNFVKFYGNSPECRAIRNRQRQRNYAQTALYEAKEWTLWEDELVMKHAIPDRDLSGLIERSVQSIQIRRCRLKKERQECG